MTDLRQRAWARFVTAQAVLLERIEAALAEAGLPPLAWYDVLWILENAPEGRLRMQDLARKAVISRSNVTRLADRMEQAGLVARADCPEDGRGTTCELQGKGRALRAKMWPVYRQQIDALFGRHLNATDAKFMTEVLENILKKARESE